MNIKNTGIAITIICQILGAAAVANEADNWQLEMINDPSVTQIRVEERGRVYIYDGLHETDVELAMNTQFDRLDNMMFVRTKFENSVGETEIADDGCD